jgi:trk system potassium uptake protein TrkA
MRKSSRFAVFGIGRYGKQIALSLASKGAEVITFDTNPSRSESIKDDVALAVTLDSTDIRSLQAQNVQEMDAAIVAIGENFEATVLTSLNLLDLGVPRVIVRSNGDHQQRILSSLGIQEILTPESEVASIVSERLIHPNIGGFLELPDDYEIAEIHAPQNCIGRTLGSIDLTNRYELRLITIRRKFSAEKEGELDQEHIIGVPKADMVIQDTDTLVVFGTLSGVKRFLEINS